MPRRLFLRCLFGLALAIRLGCAAAGGAGPSLQSVQQLVTEQEIGSVEELLPRLPLLLRSRYALVFASRSLQSSSHRSPRVILYGTTARFVLAFNGDPQDRGFDAVEMMEFDEATQQFRLQELRFRRTPDATLRAEFSAVNPDKCSACHGTDPHPIWDTRPLWPGAYGELYQQPLAAAEAAGVDLFQRSAASHPRYRHLTGIEGFVYRLRFRPSTKDRYGDVRTEPPNAELAGLLGELNLRRIAAAVLGHVSFERYRYALLATLTPNCDDVEDLFPADLQPAIRDDFLAFSRRSDLANDRQLDRKRARLHQDADGRRFASDTSIDDHNALKRFLFVVERGLGLDTAGWSLALEREAYDFTTQRSAIGALERDLLPGLAGWDPALVHQHASESRTNSRRHCALLADRSRALLEEAAARGERVLAERAKAPP